MRASLGAGLLIAAAASFASGSVEVRFDLKSDACVFLDALSDEPSLSKGYAADKDEWLPRLRKDPQVWDAFQSWRGRGAMLAYLLSVSPRPWPRILEDVSDEGGFDVQARRRLELADEPDYQYLRRHRRELLRLLEFLHAQGFDKYWARRAAPALEAARDDLEQALKRGLGDDALALAALFTGLRPRDLSGREVRLCYFGGPRDFALAGGGVCLNAGLDADQAASVVLREWLRRFMPSPRVWTLQADLKNDPFYAAAWKRIYADANEGEQEEFAAAAELYASVRLGLRTHRTALREILGADGGLPLAGYVYARLREAYPGGLPDAFDYNRFLETILPELLSLPGGVRAAHERLVEPVSGIAGLRIERAGGDLVVRRVPKGLPAARAGFHPGDVLEGVGETDLRGASAAKAADLISGRPGDAVSVRVRRGKQRARLSLLLDSPAP